MDLYSKYPEVHMTKSTGFSELRKVLAQTMRSHGRPAEIWSDGGPPYNGHKWTGWVRSWGTKPKKTTPELPPANGTVERFNQQLKHVIHTTYADNKDPEEEIQKYVAAYRNTPHSSTGEKPSKLLFNREVKTKLPRFPKASRAGHHKQAQRREKDAKNKMKKYHDRRHKTRLVEIKPGDWVYRRNATPTTTRGPWESEPFKVTKVVYNRVTADRDGQVSTRDRSDWKLVVTRPDSLQPTEARTPGLLQTGRSGGGAYPSLTSDMDDDDWTLVQTRPQKDWAAATAPQLAAIAEEPEEAHTEAPQAATEDAEQNGDPATSSSDEEGRPTCDLCGSIITLKDGTKTCLHALKTRGFAQRRKYFYNRQGDFVQVTGIAVPRWLFPNTLADDQQDEISRDVFPGLQAFFIELNRPVNKPNLRIDTEDLLDSSGPDETIPYQVLEDDTAEDRQHLREEAAPRATPPQPQLHLQAEAEQEEEDSPRYTRGGTLLGRPPRGRKKRGGP